jgi:carbon monoxide dehydrogenase subunit G
MEFDNAFDVPLPPSDAWRVLMDIERIAPCMPGAELTAKIDDSTYKGKVGVRLGPVALSFAGTAKFEDIDNANHTAWVKASGTDAKGRGGANSVVSFRVEPSGAGSKVLVHTNLTLSGSVAQYGRGAGMIQEVSAQLIKQFATSLRSMIAAEPPTPAPATIAVTEAEPIAVAEAVPVAVAEIAPISTAQAAAPARVAPPAPRPMPAPAKPISGFSLMFKVLWSSIRRIFGAKA